MSGQSMRWETALKPEELWLNSDNQILNRSERTALNNGSVLFAIELPNGELYQAEIDQVNAETASAFCEAVRGYYNEWKAEQEASSQRRVRDRAERALLDAEGNRIQEDESKSGSQNVVEAAIQAHEKGVQSTASLEEEILHRLAVTQERGQRLSRELNELLKEESQLEKLAEVLRASKVLEQTSTDVSGTVSREGDGESDAVDITPPSTPSLPR